MGRVVFLCLIVLYITSSYVDSSTTTTTTTTTSTTEAPPQPSQVAKMARYIMRNSDWVSIATKSTQDAIQGWPFVSLKSVSDGPPTNSTGTPYLYMTHLDVSGKDIEVDSRCSIMASLAELEYCKQEKFDPQDPRCAKLILTGRVIKVDPASAEYEFGQDALYVKHPAMKSWPKDHGFYVAKMDIEHIAVLDYFGGIKHVSLQDYYNAENTPRPENIVILNDIEVVQIYT